VRKLFEAGIAFPGYRFYTVFNFGARELDACFEMGDGSAVKDALVAMAKADPTCQLAQSVREMEWVKDDLIPQ
jgi:hypothetical protein